MKKYSFCEIKERLTAKTIAGFEPELSLYINNKEYMIIVYQNHCTFQHCGFNDGSGEISYQSLDSLYVTETIDGIILARDWDLITHFECDYFLD